MNKWANKEKTASNYNLKSFVLPIAPLHPTAQPVQVLSPATSIPASWPHTKLQTAISSQLRVRPHSPWRCRLAAASWAPLPQRFQGRSTTTHLLAPRAVKPKRAFGSLWLLCRVRRTGKTGKVSVFCCLYGAVLPSACLHVTVVCFSPWEMQQTGRRLCDSQRMKLRSGQLLFLGLQESMQLSHPEIRPFPCTTHCAETDTWHSAAKGMGTRHHCAMSCSAGELPSCVLQHCHSSWCTVQQSGLQHVTIPHEKLGSLSITHGLFPATAFRRGLLLRAMSPGAAQVEQLPRRAGPGEAPSWLCLQDKAGHLERPPVQTKHHTSLANSLGCFQHSWETSILQTARECTQPDTFVSSGQKADANQSTANSLQFIPALECSSLAICLTSTSLSSQCC